MRAMKRSAAIDTEERLDRPLPETVRRRVVEAAADVLGALPADEIPMPLRRVARFEPRKRARLAAAPIAAALDDDDDFRGRVARTVRESQPALAEALETGRVPMAAEPVHVAALAYLLRPSGWTARVETARRELERSATAKEEAAALRTVTELRERLTAAETGRAEEGDKLRAELRETRTEIADLRRRLHEAHGRAHREKERADQAVDRAAQERAATATASAAAEAELRRLRTRLAQAETAAEAARRAAREGRNVDDARLRVLLDALGDAAKGLRGELALPAGIARPADTVEAAEPPRPCHRTLPGRALADDDPALLDQLLTLPQVHLVVDGYNVTKTGYGDLYLVDQRARLLSGLAGLYAQTKAETTCVFDGADLDAPVAIAAPRGVRVLFSAPEETADELIDRLVRAEPRGRAVVVVSSDREVADSARRAGARPAPAALLLRRLG